MAQSPENPAGARWKPLIALCAFAATVFGVKLLLIARFANPTPFWDQWDAEAALLYQPYLDGTLGWKELFSAHNEHRIFTTRLLALALLAATGSWNPILQMVVNAALHVGALVLALWLLSRATGKEGMVALALFATAAFSAPYAWENTLAGFQAQFYLVLLFGITGLYLLTTSSPLSARWWGGVAAGTLAYFSLASGVFTLAAAAAVAALAWLLGPGRTGRQLGAIAVLVALLAAGLLFTQRVPGHDFLKATSFAQFGGALARTLAWPLDQGTVAAVLRNLPAMVFIAMVLRRPPPPGDAQWFLVGIVLLTFLHASTIAYGRAVDASASRYTDLYAVAILVNFACLLALARRAPSVPALAKAAVALAWATPVLVALAHETIRVADRELSPKRDRGQRQEFHVRSFLASNDIGHLKDKPFLHVPYPDADRLATILRSPALRAILPSALGPAASPITTAGESSGGFVAGGYFPTTPAIPGWSVGSYGAQGDRTVGTLRVTFAGTGSGGALKIPVAGYPRRDGMRLSVEQRGTALVVDVPDNPRESWGTATVVVGPGPFEIVLTDASPVTWLAIGAPSISRPGERAVARLVDQWALWIALGIALGICASMGLGGSTHRLGQDPR